MIGFGLGDGKKRGEEDEREQSGLHSSNIGEWYV